MSGRGRDIDRDELNMTRAIANVATLVRQLDGNERVVGSLNGQPVTIDQIAGILASVAAVVEQRQNDRIPGYRRAMQDVAFAMDWSVQLQGLG